MYWVTRFKPGGVFAEGNIVFCAGQIIPGGGGIVVIPVRYVSVANDVFAVEAPQLRFTESTFETPYFLDPYLEITQPIGLGIFDHILAGEAMVLFDPDCLVE